MMKLFSFFVETSLFLTQATEIIRGISTSVYQRGIEIEEELVLDVLLADLQPTLDES